MKYKDYYFKDFILDEDFQQWVLNSNENSDLFWESWLEENPHKRAEITKARIAIMELYVVGLQKEQSAVTYSVPLESVPTEEDRNFIWSNIQKSIKDSAPEIAPHELESAGKVIPMFNYITWAKVAASIVLLVMVGAVFLSKQKTALPLFTSAITYSTGFGETKEINLPDNSRVFLNANSRLIVPASWSSNSEREVEIIGEGFFSVTHTKSHQKFIVNLQKGARIEVLGTEFTVTERPTVSRVVLNKGKVKVAVDAKKTSQDASHSVYMNPGELVAINQNKGKLLKIKVKNPNLYAAFTQHKIEFNNSPLSEVARVLQDNYGYKVTFLPDSLATKRFTSSAPSNRVDLILFGIEKAFNLKLTRKGKHITFKLNQE